MEYEKDKIIQHYRKNLQKYKDGPKVHSWRSKASQFIRFKVLAEVGDLSNKTILDVGCGQGYFYDFLRENNIQVKYTGFDIVEEMIEAARKKHPEGEFLVKDILTEEVSKTFDYVISSGVNNIKTASNEILIRCFIEKMFKLCELGVAVNMLSSYANPQDKNSYYAKPKDLFKFSMELTHKVVLRHDYKPNDFTLYLYR